MWLWLRATAKADATPEDISAKRRQWAEQGKDQQLAGRCRFQQRYIIKDATPPQVFWLLETDAAETAGLITEHFGTLWDISIQEVVPQGLREAPPR